MDLKCKEFKESLLQFKRKKYERHTGLFEFKNI